MAHYGGGWVGGGGVGIGWVRGDGVSGEERWPVGGRLNPLLGMFGLAMSPRNAMQILVQSGLKA